MLSVVGELRIVGWEILGKEMHMFTIAPTKRCYAYRMEISLRDLLTALHGMGFGALFMLAFSGAIAELYRMSALGPNAPSSARGRFLLRVYLVIMVVLAWATVLSGTYIIYPWYRAVPPAGADLAGYAKALLISSPTTSSWHTLGMEWKEHVAWIAPIAMTMVAYVFATYGPALARQRQVRTATLVFIVIAFVATGIAGAFGAFLNKYAPIRGGPVIQIMQGNE